MKLKYPGVPVYMNGQNYYIPSLSTRDFRANYETLTAAPAADASPSEPFDRYIPVILLAVARNYPDVTQEQLEDWLDLYTFRLAIAAVQNASGMTPVTEGE
jgi:hypothetical protein